MSPTRPRRALRVLPVIALSVLAVAASQSVSASTPPTVPTDSAPTDSAPTGSSTAESLPEGYVRLVDDTGFITVVVPDAWIDVVTAPATSEEDGSSQPYITAAPDIAEYEITFDVAGVRYVALPFTDDPETVITRAGLEEGCETVEVQPYEDPVFTGVVQVGTNCGTGGGTWNMIVASPDDESFTAVVQVQTASEADQEAFELVLNSFTYVPGGMLTGSSVPGVETTSG